MLKDFKDKMLRPIRAVERKIGQACLVYGIKKSPEYFNARVAEVAKQVATNFINQEMAKQGMIKCTVPTCLKRSPLRKYSGAYVCESHYQALSKKIPQGASK